MKKKSVHRVCAVIDLYKVLLLQCSSLILKKKKTTQYFALFCIVMNNSGANYLQQHKLNETFMCLGWPPNLFSPSSVTQYSKSVWSNETHS